MPAQLSETLYIKTALLRRDMERFFWNLTHSRPSGPEAPLGRRPVGVNPQRREFLKLAGIGAVGLVIAKIGFGESTNQLINKSTNALNNLILRKGKKLVFLNRKGESVLEVS